MYLRSKKAIEIGLLIFIVVWAYSLLIIAAWHSYPNPEDYEVSCVSRDIGILQSVKATMVGYDGRYTTNLFHAINPLAFNYIKGYSVMNILGVVLANLSIFCFMSQILVVTSRFFLFLYSALITVVFMGCILSYATFFMMTGNFVYLYCNSFALFFITFFIKYLRANRLVYDKIYFVTTSTTLVLAIGFTELYLPFYFLLLFSLLFYYIYMDRQFLSKYIPLFIIGIFLLLFFITTPGVTERISGNNCSVSKASLTEVLTHGLYNYITFLVTTILKPICFASILYGVIMFQENTFILNIKFSRKLTITLFTITVISSMLMTFAYYLPTMDAVTYPQKIYTPILFVLLILAFGFLCSYLKLTVITNFMGVATVKIILLIIILADFVNGDNYIARIQEDYHSGKLTAFKYFMDNRISLLRDAAKSEKKYKTAIVPRLERYPITVYDLVDIETDRVNSKWNKCYEEYFQLDEVVVQGDTNRKFRSK